MKRSLLIAVITIVLLAAVSCARYDGPAASDFATNENVIKSQSFRVSSESTELDTWVAGTIFLSGESGVVERARIVAMVQIDPEDWGGVTLTVPVGWEISGITSSYPEGGDEDPAGSIVALFTASTKYEFNEMIEIGTNRWTPTGGGTGTVIVELDATDSASDEKFSSIIGVGSEIRNGVKVMNPDHETIEISLPQQR